MAMEFSKNGTASILTHTPVFVNLEGGVNWEKVNSHLKDALTSEFFVGFTISSICETEDLVSRLNIYPHVFLERTVLYKPNHPQLSEMCMLLSMLEHVTSPTPKFLLDVLHRATKLAGRLGSRDAAFLLAGIETVVATISKISNLQLPLETAGKLPPPLVPFLLDQSLEGAEHSPSGFLRAIYLTSFKMNRGDDTPPPRESIQFNIFYQDTLFAKHFQNQAVVASLRKICQETRPRTSLLQ